MNANELADLMILFDSGRIYEHAEEIANMLRQQQSEIAELKHMNRNWQISENILLLELEKLQHCELTDEEINELYADYQNPDYYSREVIFDQLGFAKAILRKVQEK